LDEPDTTPIPKVLAFLEGEKGLRVIHANDLGFINGRRTRGKTRLKEGVIILDSEMVENDEVSYFMTAAHEIGHWSLHRSRKIILNEGQFIESFEDDENSYWDEEELSVVNKKRDLSNPINRLEHQAKVFAANLLMPRESFIKAVIAAQHHLGVSQHKGQIYLTDYKNDYYPKLVEMLQVFFKVSKQALNVRFKQLDMLVDQRGKTSINKEAIRAESIRRAQQQEWRRIK
jgi:Zn-dependent peptidase ImmA (M78 family)